MRLRTLMSLMFVGGLLALSSGLAAQRSDSTAPALLRRAIDKEIVDGDLKGAIEIYRQVVSQSGSNRALAAEALLRMADTYQQLGSTEARKVYEQILKDYADQNGAVSTAQTRLAALGVGRPTEPGPTSRVVCTDCLGDDTGINLGSEGRLIAFTDEASDLAIRDMATGNVKRLMAKGKGPKELRLLFPALSPDSRQVAYFTRFDPDGDQLRVMPNEPGAHSRTLVKNPEFDYVNPMAWSPDGKSILVEMQHTGDGTWQIAWVSASDGRISVLKSLDWRHRGFEDRPALSPDGKYIVYAALVNNPRNASAVPNPPGKRIYVLAADLSSERELTDTATYYGHPVFSPDGTQVFFTSDRRSGTKDRLDLWAIPVRSGKAAGAPSLLKTDVGDSETELIGVTRSGVLHYYVYPAGTPEVRIVEVPRDGAVPNRSAWTPGGIGDFPAWSPDGKSLARFNESQSSIVVRSLETGEDHVFTYGAYHDLRGLRWLHDGSGLLVVARRAAAAGQDLDLYRLDLAPGEFRRVLSLRASPQRQLYPRFALSPDDKTGYFFESDTTNRETLGAVSSIVAVELATGQRRQVVKLTNAGLFWSSLALSRDGGTLAIQLVTLPGTGLIPPVVASRLATVNVDGTGYRDIYGPFNTHIRFSESLGWTSDRQIVFSAAIGAEHQVMRIGASGGQPVPVGIESRLFDVSPDGSRIAIAQHASPKAELWAIDVSSLLKKPQ